MAEFFLPPTPGLRRMASLQGAARTKNIRVFKIYRFDPDLNENPRLDTYEVDMDSCGPMVLDALIKIRMRSTRP